MSSSDSNSRSDSPSNLDTWTSTPSISSTLFGMDLPYRPPRSPLGRMLWRKRVWIETTFGLSVLERWEKALVLAIVNLTFILVLTGMFKYVPRQLPIYYVQFVYYVHGNQTANGSLPLDTSRPA